MVDMVFGDVRRGKLKPNPLPNLPPKPLLILIFTMDMDMDLDMDTMDLAMAVTMDMDMDSAMVDTMDVDILDTTDMALDTMDADTIGENKSQIHKTHYQHSASKCLDGNNDDLSFCCRTQSL